MTATRARALGFGASLVVVLAVSLRWFLLRQGARDLREGENLREMLTAVNGTVTRTNLLLALAIFAAIVAVGALWLLARKAQQPQDWVARLHWFTVGNAVLITTLLWSTRAGHDGSSMQQLRPEDATATVQDVSAATDRVAELPLPEPSIFGVALLACWLAFALLLLAGTRHEKAIR